VRCRLAERHLLNPKLSLAEVALMIGFADQSGFQHAFKRWKGASPGEYRRRFAPA
jgi:AraC-like DNA-binding protein